MIALQDYIGEIYRILKDFLSVHSPDRTSYSTQNLSSLKIVRDPAMQTGEAFFGRMYFGNSFLCYTMERIAVAIPTGVYNAHKRDSAHFGMRVVGIDVPNRTDIECHFANLPSQLNGCIAVGESKDGDALDSSRTAFDAMMSAVPEEFTVSVE